MKASPGTPAYKSQEEYYDQILEYKKQVGALNQESSNMKAKIRRLEEDNLKKEKEIDSLLNPQKVSKWCFMKYEVFSVWSCLPLLDFCYHRSCLKESHKFVSYTIDVNSYQDMNLKRIIILSWIIKKHARHAVITTQYSGTSLNWMLSGPDESSGL